MRLRTQVVIGIGSVAILVIALLLGVVVPQVRHTFAALESDEVQKDVARVHNAVTAELSALEATANDWAEWDDTVAFIRGEAPGYVGANLEPATFENLRLNFMAFFDVSGRLVFAQGFDLDRNESAPFDVESRTAVEREVARLSAGDAASSYTDLLALGSQFGLVALHPILNSQHEPPRWGTVAIGRVLTTAEIARLAAQVELPVAITRLEAADLPQRVAEALRSKTSAFVVPLNEVEVAGYSLWNPRNGVATALLSVVVPRDTYMAGQNALRYLLGALFSMLVVLAGIFLAFLNARVLSRMVRLTHDVAKIAESKGPTERVAIKGKDELADLGAHINGMLASIEESHTALDLSEKRYRNLFESSRDPIYITAEDGRFIDVNQALVDLLGYTKDEVMSMNAGDFYVRPEDREGFRAAIEEKGFVIGYPVTLRKKDGSHANCLLTTILEDVEDGKARGYQGIIRDVTELLQQQEKLTFLATHDPLTGLLTRGALDDVLRLEIARAVRNLERLAVFYLDLDKFKEVNDTHGHAAGDLVLKEVGARLRDALRASDTVARLGGDEFVALLPGIDSPRDAEIAADKVLQALRDAFEIPDNGRLGLSVSIGIALFPDDGDNSTNLLQSADAAMYTAKIEGRDGWRRFESKRVPPSQS